MNSARRPLHLSQLAKRSSEQAIGFLMQQALENSDCISLAAGFVDEATLPANLTRNTIQSLLTDDAAGRRILQYGITTGPESLRESFRKHLAHLEHTDPESISLDNLMLTTGSQQLLCLAAQAVFEPDDICLVAAPTYFVFMGVLDAVGAKAVPVHADEDGMCPVDLDRQLQQLDAAGLLPRVRMVYVVSYYDNPSGVSVSADRRPQLLDVTKRWSKHDRILLLEDAAYREVRFDGPELPSIWSFDTDKDTVILTQTFSKSFAPGIRVGLSVLPDDLVKPVSNLKANEDFGSPHLNQAVLARILDDDQYLSHVQKVVQAYQKKRDAMLTAADEFFSDLNGVSWYTPSGGLYVWMSLPDHVSTSFDSELFHQATRVSKVMYVPGELCHPVIDGCRPNYQMRLSYGVQSEDGIREGMKRLASAVRTVLK